MRPKIDIGIADNSAKRLLNVRVKNSAELLKQVQVCVILNSRNRHGLLVLSLRCSYAVYNRVKQNVIFMQSGREIFLKKIVDEMTASDAARFFPFGCSKS